MKDIFITCLKIIKNYTGMRPLLLITFAMWIYLLKAEKVKARRIAFVYFPALLMVVFVCPITYYLYDRVHLDVSTYYRLIWVIPMGVITAYGLTKLFGGKMLTRVIGVIVSVALIAIAGKCVYTSDHVYASSNIYGIPDDPINVVDAIRAVDDSQRITVLCPNVLTFYVRQYDANICMPYGREMFDVNNDYTDPLYEAFELSDVICMEDVLELTRNVYEVSYIVFYAGQTTDVSPEEAGLQHIATVGNYTIYLDPVMDARVKEYSKYYEEES